MRADHPGHEQRRQSHIRDADDSGLGLGASATQVLEGAHDLASVEEADRDQVEQVEEEAEEGQCQPEAHARLQVDGVAHAAGERPRQRPGDGDVRLTVWQNLLISGVADDKVARAVAAIDELGLSTKATSIRAGLVACTGNVGCKFAASDTKRHAEAIAQWCESRVTLDSPLNIHLTGCPNSCAQHYIGDIGLLGTKVSVEDDMVEGYHIFLGGGYGPDQDIGREIYRDVKAEDAPALIERMLRGYLAARLGPEESFRDFTRRCSTEQLLGMFELQDSRP